MSIAEFQEEYFNFKNMVSESTPESKQKTLAETNNIRYGTLNQSIPDNNTIYNSIASRTKSSKSGKVNLN